MDILFLSIRCFVTRTTAGFTGNKVPLIAKCAAYMMMMASLAGLLLFGYIYHASISAFVSED
jgi:hypothetical protein